MKFHRKKLILFKIMLLLHLNIMIISVPTIKADSLITNEWWIQMEIFSTDPKQQKYNDEILIDLFDEIIVKEQSSIKSWHFFREPTLRFRIEAIDKKQRDRIAIKLDDYLDTSTLVINHYLANHSQKVESIDEGYSGEYRDYKLMWPYQKEIWRWGSEMTVATIKERQLFGDNEPSTEYQLVRAYHIMANQLSPGFDKLYCFRRDHDGGILVNFFIISSFFLGFVVCCTIFKYRQIRRTGSGKMA